MKTNIQFIKVNRDSRAKLNFATGDMVRVWNKLKDKDGKVRLQAYEGLVIARKHGTEINATFTVRKIASGVGVEKIYPLYSSNIDRIEIVKKNKTRRSKLYYIREKALRDIRRKLKADTQFVKKDGITTTAMIEDMPAEGNVEEVIEETPNNEVVEEKVTEVIEETPAEEKEEEKTEE